MAGKKHWTEKKESPGIHTITFSNYRWFFDYIQMVLLDYKTYVFRGQRDSSWSLLSSLDREYKILKKKRTDTNTKWHLDKFKMATRGRMSNLDFNTNDDNEWWAIGQHYGLKTPLLDWSESPFVALYFAFEEAKKSSSENRAIFAIAKSYIKNVKNNKIKSGTSDYIDIINPMNNENSRLVNQRGLFLSMPPNSDIESYVKSNVDSSTKSKILFKFIIPDKNREVIFKYLNKMNISKLTLYPDLIGASEYVNSELQIKGY